MRYKVTIFLLLASLLARADTPAYRLMRELPIGSKEGGWDYLTVDPSSRHLYLAQSQRVLVIDIDQNKVVGEITDTPGVHGFAVAPRLGRGFASNGKESKVSIVDLATLKTITKVPTAENPDAILYDPIQMEVYAFNGRGKSATVIQAKTGEIAATIPLPGKPEFAAVDPDQHRVFVNIEDQNIVVVLDSLSHKVASKWNLAPGNEPTGMTIDIQHHRLFVGCHNQILLMLDAMSGKVLASVPIGKGVDAVAFDPETGIVFSSNGEGTVTIAHEDTRDTLRVIQTLKTEPGARTMALDSKSHRIYLPSAQFEKPSGDKNQRPKIVPGSLKLLVYGS